MKYFCWIVLVVCAGIFLFRIGYDVKTYLFGSTLACRGTEYDYLLHLPSGYTDFDEPRPLLVFLHGAGEINKGLDVLKGCDVWHFAKGHVAAKDYPFITVSPMTPRHGWEPLRVVRLVEDVIARQPKRYRIDPTRIYLTGYSMGGFGTFAVACEYPERFAAIAPLAGGGDPEQAGRLKSVPTWAFHGNADKVVAYECSAKMIAAIQTAGGEAAKLTTLEGAGHGIVGDVYRNPDLYRWMLEHQVSH